MRFLDHVLCKGGKDCVCVCVCESCTVKQQETRELSVSTQVTLWGQTSNLHSPMWYPLYPVLILFLSGTSTLMVKT